MEKIRKMPTEREMINQLRSGKVSLPPLSLRFLEGDQKARGNLRFDALVEASWRGSIAKFAVECKSLSTPKAFQDGLNLLKTSSLPKGYQPLLFLPFLSERQLQELEGEGISGIDLCGNGVVVVPGMFASIPQRREEPLLFFCSDQEHLSGKTVPWWGGSFSSAPATKPFRRSARR